MQFGELRRANFRRLSDVREELDRLSAAGQTLVMRVQRGDAIETVSIALSSGGSLGCQILLLDL